MTIRTALAAGIALMLSAVSGSAVAQTGVSGGVLPTARMLAPVGLERMWWSQATLNPTRDKVRHVVADEEVLIVQSTSGVTTAFDAENGRKLWAIQIGRSDQASFPIITNDEYALAVVGMKLYGIHKRTGDIIWEVNLPTHPSTSPATDQNHVYVGSLDGSVYCFDLHRIKKLYNENLLPQWSAETLVWRFKTAREVTSPPISDGTRVSFASSDRTLYSVTAARRDLVFQFETDAPIAAPLGQLDNWLFLASQDLNFYCINSLNGQVRWDFICGSPVRKPPYIVNRKVYLMPDRGGLFCLDADNGRQNWWRPKITDFIAVSKSFVFLTDENENVVVASPENGTIRGVLPLRGFPRRIHNQRTDRVFLASEAGMVVAIRERGREFPTYHMYPDKRPIVPLFAPEGIPEAPAQPADPNAQNQNAAGANENN